MKKYFLTYGDEKFKYSKIHLIELAKKSKFFDEFISLGPDSLNEDFKKKFNDILLSKRGGGYWIWKHEIISRLINDINNNDIVFYCDAGSSINLSKKANKRFVDYLNIIQDPEITFLRFEAEKKFLENLYTTKEIFNAFDIALNSEIRQTTQLQAGVMFFKKNKISLSLLNDYKEVLYNDPDLITDKYSENQSKEFVECRHDQSIFSILGKQYNSYILENETEFKNRIDLQYDFPILTVRASNHGLKDRLKLKYLKFFYGKKTKYFN